MSYEESADKSSVRADSIAAAEAGSRDRVAAKGALIWVESEPRRDCCCSGPFAIQLDVPADIIVEEKKGTRTVVACCEVPTSVYVLLALE